MSQIVQPEDKEDWIKWERICEYTEWDPNGLLRPMRYRGLIIPFSQELGVGPNFFNELLTRVNKVQPIRIAIVGEAGSSKTYTAIHIANVLDLKLDIKQIILYGKEYLEIQRTLSPRKPITLEEPTFHLAARTWQDQWQKIIVQTIESTRFQNTPLLIPCVNRNLIDKTVREYYINYVIEMYDRGIGRIFRTSHSQWYDKLIRRTAFNIYFYGPGMLIAECGRETCLECPELPTCNKNIYPQYERKRAEAINFYQERGEKEMIKAEMAQEKELTFSEMFHLSVEERETFVREDPKEGKVYMDQEIMLRFDIGHNKARDIRVLLDKHYPL